MLSEPPADKVPRFRPRKVTHDELFLISYFVDLKVDPAKRMHQVEGSPEIVPLVY